MHFRRSVMSDDYKQILQENPNYRVFDGHLVDIMDTLVVNGKLNEPLYKSMEEAADKGENIFLYSSYFNPKDLTRLGVDTKKFPILSKDADILRRNEAPLVVLGKVVDDRHPDEQLLNIIMADDNNLIDPRKNRDYSFTRKELPEELKDRDLCAKIKQRLQNKKRGDILAMKENKFKRALVGAKRKLQKRQLDKQDIVASNYEVHKEMAPKLKARLQKKAMDNALGGR